MTNQPLFSFSIPGEMYTCGQQTIAWNYAGTDTNPDMAFAITDINVEQKPPLSSTVAALSSATSALSQTQSISSAPEDTSTDGLFPPTPTTAYIGGRPPVRRQNGYGGAYLPNINQVIVTGLRPSDPSWTWPSVNVTQGWYILTATFPSSQSYTSSPFFVLNGTSVECLSPSAPSVPQSGSSTDASGPTSAPSSGNDSSTGGTSSSSNSHTGAIAGGVVGGLAAIALIIAMAFILFRRRQRASSARAHRAHSAFVPGAPSKRSRRVTESMQALSTTAHGPSTYGGPVAGYMNSTKDSDEFFMVDPAEKSPVSPAPYTTMAGVPQSQLPSSRKAKRTSSSSFGPTQTSPPAVYKMSPRSHSQPGVARENSMSTDSHGHRSSSSAMSPPPLQIPTGVEPTNLGERTPASAARRKPVPKYDAGEFDGTATAPAGASRAMFIRDDTTTLQHQGSFSSLRRMHVMMPDMPPPPRD